MKLFSGLRWGGYAPPPLEGRDAAWSIIDSCGDGMLHVDDDGRVRSANPAAAALFAREVHRLIGARLRDLVVREDADVVDTHQRKAREGAPQRFEARIPAGAQTRVVAVTVARATLPQPSAEGGATLLDGTVVTLRDVTDERSALDDLVGSEARYRHLFEGASDAIMTFDSLGRFTTINRAGELISGYPRGELVGHFFGPLLAVESLPKAILEFRRALTGVTGQFDAVIVRKSGERRYITVNYTCPQRSREVLCVIRDATEEKALQQQLIQSEKMAAIGQLVSGVAHELNNPLASISAFAQLMLSDTAIGPEQRHLADVIRAEARRAARIVHNLLTFARQHKYERVHADVNKVISDTLELRSYELNVRGIELVTELTHAPAETMVDVYQLQQVLLNLVTNAEHAMGEVERSRHRLTVRTRVFPDVIRIDVEDTGPGLTPEVHALIFNPFFTTKPTGQGTGLGLSISLGIITEHQGRIWAENLVAGGCRFTIELPRVAATAGAQPSTPAEAVPMRKGLRILVADDEEPIRFALDRFLTSAGHTVVTVSSGSEALWRGEGDEEFDVILLDIRMPDLSGRQIFERWRRERPELAARIVFVTGDIMSADLQAFLSGTERPFFAKPFEFDTILRAITEPGAA